MLENAPAISAKIITFLIVFFCVSNAQAATKTSEFLRLDDENQSSFFSITITAFGFVASLTDPKIANCINDWYPDHLRKKRHSEMLEQMKAYPDYHPTAVVLSLIQHECGEFN